MKTYTIDFEGGAFATVTVEAESLEEAIELAFEEVPHSVCAQCGGWDRPWSLETPEEWELAGSYTEDGEFHESGAQ